MAALFKKAMLDCLKEEEYIRPNKVSSVYDCCLCYWLPIDERMWSGQLDFKFITNWAEDVELDFTEDDDINIGIKTPKKRLAARPTNRSTSFTNIRSCVRRENWDNELVKLDSSNWEGEFYTDYYVNSFYISNGESWEGEFYPDSYIRSFGGLCFKLFKESWEGELLF